MQVIELGRFEMDTWYYSPYPEPFASQQRLLICEFCLKYFRKKKTLLRHLSKCCPTHPPGDEIYRSPPPSDRAPSGASVNPPIAMFEVDGNKNKVSRRRQHCACICICILWQVAGSILQPALGGGIAAPLLWRLVGGGMLMASHARRCTARACACCPSCSWTTRRCTMMWTPSSSTSCARWMMQGEPSPGCAAPLPAGRGQGASPF